MKYVLMFIETEQFAEDLAAMAPDERERAYQRVDRWFADHAGRIRASAKLKGPQSATTIRLDGAKPMTTDGPFIEGKEVVSGFALIEADDLDEALRVARDWPGCPVVEVRPAES